MPQLRLPPDSETEKHWQLLHRCDRRLREARRGNDGGSNDTEGTRSKLWVVTAARGSHYELRSSSGCGVAWLTAHC